MKKLMTVCSLILLNSVSFLSFAQETKDVNEQSVILTVEQAVEYGMKNSRSMKSAEIDLELKKRASSTSWNCFLPSVNLTGTMARSSNDTVESSVHSMDKILDALGVPSPEVDITESMHWAAVGGLNVSWNFSLAYIGQIKSAKAQAEAGLITYEKALRETEVNIRKLFYGLLLSQENLEITRTSVNNARDRYLQAKTNFENGLIPELQLLSAEVSYLNKRPELSNTERLHRQQIDTFAFILGYPVGTDIKLQGSIDVDYIDADFDSLMKLCMENSLDLKNLEKNIALVKLGKNTLNLSTYTPAIAFSYGFQPMLTDALDADWGDSEKWSDNGSLSITFAWNLTNLLPWSSTQQQTKDLKQTMKQLQIQKEMLMENQKMQVRKSLDTLIESREQIASMERNVNLAQQSYDMYWKMYKSGMTERLDLEDAQSQLNQAKLGLASQKFNYISALLDLETTVNTNLSK